jgi:hypothetical protein
MVEALENPCDIWFLDGHGPKTNPQIWRRELLLAVGEKTCSGGNCATYTVAGDVKRALVEAGFQVEKVQGCDVRGFGIVTESEGGFFCADGGCAVSYASDVVWQGEATASVFLSF